MTLISRQVRLARRPAPGFTDASTWEIIDELVRPLPEGSALIRTLYCSLDPAMRTWLNAGKSYVPAVEVGEVMRAYGIGIVVESRADGLVPGDHVAGRVGIQTHAILPGDALTKIDATADMLPLHLGALGISGMTAYFGLLDVGRAKAGDTILVSAAAGSVGSIAAQIGKAIGARVVGVAGGADKCRYLTDTLGLDGAIDYKAGGLDRAVRDACSAGIDVFFDNTGGPVLNAALRNLARGARIVLSGAVSQYNATDVGGGPTNYMNLLVARASMTGFVIFDYEDRYAAARATIAEWIAVGAIRADTHVVDGIDSFPDALNALFAGKNIGKFVLKIATA